MAVHVARAPDVVAAVLRWSERDAFHRVKSLRLDKKWRQARGRGFIPARTDEVATVIALIMEGGPQALSPAALDRVLGYANVAPLEAVYARREGEVYAIRAAEVGTDPVTAIAHLIDGWRWGPMREHMRLFGDVRLVSAGRDDGQRQSWFAFDVQGGDTVFFDPEPDIEAFRRGIAPAWAKPGGMIQTSMVHTGHLQELAVALGDLSEAPEWPKYVEPDPQEISPQDEERRASEADAPFPRPVAPSATSEQNYRTASYHRDTDRARQRDHPTLGLGDDPEWTTKRLCLRRFRSG